MATSLCLTCSSTFETIISFIHLDCEIVLLFAISELILVGDGFDSLFKPQFNHSVPW